MSQLWNPLLQNKDVQKEKEERQQHRMRKQGKKISQQKSQKNVS